MLDELVERYRALEQVQAPGLAQALVQIRLAVVAMCEEVTRDARRYAVHERLLNQNPELHDRGVRKLQRLTEAVGEILRAQGASELTAALAPQLALACYHAGRQLAGTDPEALTAAVNSAFDQLKNLVQ